MEFTKETFEEFRKAFKISVGAMEKLYDVTIEPGSIKYTNSSFTLKVEVKKNNVGNGLSADEADFKLSCRHYGLQPDDFGKTVKVNTSKFGRIDATICGIAPRRRKYPIKVVTPSGGRYIMEAWNAANQLHPKAGA